MPSASKTGAVAAVSAIKAAEPEPEPKAKTMAIKVVAIIEWLKSISKHQIAKGTALGEVVLKMSKLHIVTKISMFWLKFQGDPETD